jgi:hypothetical protein
MANTTNDLNFTRDRFLAFMDFGKDSALTGDCKFATGKKGLRIQYYFIFMCVALFLSPGFSNRQSRCNGWREAICRGQRIGPIRLLDRGFWQDYVFSHVTYVHISSSFLK